MCGCLHIQFSHASLVCWYHSLRGVPLRLSSYFYAPCMNDFTINVLCFMYFFFIILLSDISAQAKKDLKCLDSAGVINVLCSNSDRYNNTNCYTSLSNQGLISTPTLVTVCVYYSVCVCCVSVHLCVCVLCVCPSVCVCVCVYMCVCVWGGGGGTYVYMRLGNCQYTHEQK